jgi:glutamate 5-kinase
VTARARARAAQAIAAAPERALARKARRLVVKLGSSTLTDASGLRERVFGELARQVASLRAEARQVVIVSSGAIAAGSRTLGWTRPGRSIPEKQAAAAVGQVSLMELYRRRFARHGIPVGQVLVTRTGLENRERYLNARHTLLTLLSLGAVPIVNENDTVATDEIKFGDNDNLSATIVNLVEAELLVIFTDVDGLYQRPPEAGHPTPPVFSVVREITREISAAASGSSSAFGRGGMTTKLEAARSAAHSGAATVLCNGRARNALLRVAAGEELGTLFLPGNRLASRKHWLAFTRVTRGALHLDAGAARALAHQGKSLLPAGIARVDGEFGVGDPVACLGPDGSELARGLVNYDAQALRRIAGQATQRIERTLGYSNGPAVIHRDDLVLTTSGAADENSA